MTPLTAAVGTGPPEVRRDLRLHRLRSARCPALVAVLTAAFLGWLVVGIGGPSVTLVVVDMSELGAALVATACCGRRSRRETGTVAKAWLLLSLSTGSWAAGACIWNYYELLAGRNVPFPSAADGGFLLAVPFAVAAMLMFFRPPHGWTSQFRVLVVVRPGETPAGMVMTRTQRRAATADHG